MKFLRPLYNRIWKKLTIALLLATFLPIGYFLYQSLNATEASVEDRETMFALQNTMMRSKEVESTFINALMDVNYLRSSFGVEFFSRMPGRTIGKAYWKTLVEKEFYTFLSLRPGYASVGMLDEYGNERLIMFKNGEKIVSLPDKSLHNRITSTYYIEVARQKEYGIAAIPMGSMVSQRTDVFSQPLIRFATKIFDSSGRPRGVIYVDINGADIISKLSHTSLEQRQKVAMVTQNGDYVFNPYRKSGGDNAEVDGGNIKDEFPSDIVAQMLSGRVGVITDDTQNIFAFRPIYLQSENKDYYYVIFDRYPRANFVPIMDRVKMKYLIGSFEALFLCIFVVAGVSYTLTRDLEKLREGVENIRLHKLDYRLNMRSSGEIESLADAYNMMADSLQEYSQSLEKKVEERSGHIQRVEKKLMQAEKLAAIGFLAAGVAHEINNPISILITRLELIKRDIDKGKIEMLKKDLDVLYTHSVRIGTIAKNLLTFSRSGDSELVAANINEIAERVISLIEMPIKKKGIKLERLLEPGLPDVSLNVSGMEQVIYNIAYNAYQATDTGGTITIRTGMDKESGVVFEVRDTGHGIKRETIDHIFDPFFTTKEVGSGTGLGLAICYGIVKDAGGSISVESEPGVGTAFTVHIPFTAHATDSRTLPKETT